VLNWLSDVIALNFVARSASTAVRLSFSLLSTSWWRQYESGGFKRGGLEMFETRSATIAVRLSSSLLSASWWRRSEMLATYRRGRSGRMPHMLAVGHEFAGSLMPEVDL